MRLILLVCLLFGSALVQAFDQTHGAWDRLLKRNVILLEEGNASRVNYAGMQVDRAALKGYLRQLSVVKRDEYQSWNRDQQLAFLINAYNAFTVELILTKYPAVESIKEFGSLFRSPWKQRFFTLLGERRHLDNVEQDMIRAPGVFAEPRIHFALNCASIGCPMLRNEAYVGTRLEEQLEDATQRFLADRERNRFDASGGTLWASKIFDWYEEDFTSGTPAPTTLKDLFSDYVDQLTQNDKVCRRLKTGDYRIDFLDYDWRLNDISQSITD